MDLSTADEAQKAIQELAGKFILERKVSVQLARKPETPAEKQAAATSGAEGSGGEGGRRRNSGRGRARGRGRGGRSNRGGRSVSLSFIYYLILTLTRYVFSVKPMLKKMPLRPAKYCL